MWFACCSGGARACRKAGNSISNYDQQNCLPGPRCASAAAKMLSCFGRLFNAASSWVKVGFFLICVMIFATRFFTNQMLHTSLKFLVIPAACIIGQAHAVTADDLMKEAFRVGRSKGELTGAIANNFKKTTHSNEPIQASAELVSIDKDKCQIYKFTLLQSKIPNRAGQIVGDYMTVTKTKFCPDNREQEPPQVIDCRIGGASCMPPNVATGSIAR